MDRLHLPLVTIFGASGFVGTPIVQLLARKGFRIRAAVRRPDLAGDLKPLGDVGQIAPIQANVRDSASVTRAVAGADVVINLVGIGYQRARQRFDDVHVEGARRVAEAAAATGATTLVHMSILGADPDSDSDLVRSRALGEAAVLEAFPDAVIMRPSVMFGQGDGYFNLMGTLARLSPVMPLIGGKSRLQPVFVGDVAEAFAAAAAKTVTAGRIYELGGPDVLTHKQLLQRVLSEAGRSNPLLPLPAGIAKLLALPFKLSPYPPLLTADQVIQLGTDNVVSEAAIRDNRTLAAFGIAPTPMDAILPTYMWRFRKNGQFDRQTE